jgi:tight adherence protein B
MNVSMWAAPACGAAAGGGLFAAYAGWRGLGADDLLPPDCRESARAWVRRRAGRHPIRRLLLCAAAGIAASAVTGWAVAGPLAVWAAWSLPLLLGPDRANTERTARIEAIAAWTEQLRDTLAAASGLEQSLQATAHLAPQPIRAQVADLAARLDAREPLPVALRHFADALADPLADLVVIALTTAADRQAGRLGDLLAALADTAREQAKMRLRTAAARARVRTSVRVVVATTLALAAGLALFDRSYLAPYNHTGGQLVLLCVAGLFATAFTYLGRLGRFPAPPRLLAGQPVDGSAAPDLVGV